jgi:hypothetical protein
MNEAELVRQNSARIPPIEALAAPVLESTPLHQTVVEARSPLAENVDRTQTELVLSSGSLLIHLRSTMKINPLTINDAVHGIRQ